MKSEFLCGDQPLSITVYNLRHWEDDCRDAARPLSLVSLPPSHTDTHKHTQTYEQICTHSGHAVSPAAMNEPSTLTHIEAEREGENKRR